MNIPTKLNHVVKEKNHVMVPFISCTFLYISLYNNIFFGGLEEGTLYFVYYT